jgi:hypothetical protein
MPVFLLSAVGYRYKGITAINFQRQNAALG